MLADGFSRLLLEPAPEIFVRKSLACLESLLRELALVALADWDGLEIVSPDLSHAVAGLQRPSFGQWNGIVSAMRSARRSFLRGASSTDRERFQQAHRLQRILNLPDDKCPSDVAEELRPLGKFVHLEMPPTLRLGTVLAAPIALRNLVYHNAPTDPRWWSDAAERLRPLVVLHDRRRLWEFAGPQDELPSPWFEHDEKGVWTFNGLDRRNPMSAVYVAPDGSSPRLSLGQVPPLLQAFQRLLGKRGVQEENFRRLFQDLAPDDEKGVMLGDYLVGPPVGRGGYATVHRATQLSTGRKVAIKILRDGMPEATRLRFRQEAAYLSRVSSPGIVGVLGYGEDAWTAPRHVRLDDQPWFQEFSKSSPVKSYISLEWIEGRTLEEIYRSATENDPPMPILHAWFREAAEALQAVHAAGLVHRDVKPSNLMVDADGGVKLMDFGIARTHGEMRTVETTTGRQLGTPAYMAPEQLKAVDGETEVGPAADVYGLSATFYELYTGVRLYRHDAETAHSVETRKLEGEAPERPRRCRPRLPWEVETILLGGLQTEVGDRYPSMSAIQRDLEHLLRNEPLEYRRPSLPRRLQLWRRRNPALAGLFGVSALLVIVFLAGFVMVVQRRQAERLNQQLAAGDLENAERSLREDDAEHTIQSLQRAQGRLDAADSVPLRQRWRSLQKDVEFAAELDKFREQSLRFLPGTVVEAPMGKLYDEAFRRRGIRIAKDDATAVAASIDASPIRERIVEALHHWFGNDPPQRGRLLAVLDRLPPKDAWLTQIRRVIRDEQGDLSGDTDAKELSPHGLRCAILLLQNPSEMVRISRKLAGATPTGPDVPQGNAKDLALASRLCLQAQELQPDDFLFNLFAAGASWSDSPRRADDALGFARAALAQQPQSPAANYLVGFLLLEGKNDLPQAITYLNRTAAIDPRHVGAQAALGQAMLRSGNVLGAIAAQQKAIELEPKLACLHSNLAQTLNAVGDVNGAITAAQKAVTLDPQFARGHNNLGMLLRGQGKLDEAIRHLRRAVELDRSDALAYFNLGAALKQNKDYDGAIAAYRRSLELDPRSAVAYNNLAFALDLKGNSNEAIGVFEQAIAIDPRNATYCSNLGNILRETGDLKGAIRYLRRAIELEPQDAVFRNNLARALQQQGDPDGAAAEYRKAVELDDKFATALVNLGVLLLNQGKPDDAIGVLQKAISVEPTSARAHYNLGAARLAKGLRDEAVADFADSIRYDPSFAPAHNDLAKALWEKGDLPGAKAEFERATAIDSKFAAPWINLSNLLLAMSDVEAAIGAGRKAVELSPESQEAHNNLAAALHTCRKWDEAVTEYKAAIRISPEVPQPYKNLADLYLAMGKEDDAIAIWRKVVTLDPHDAMIQQALAIGVKRQKDREELLTAAAQSAESRSANSPFQSARAAILASERSGDDAGAMSDADRSHFRNLALGWMRKELGSSVAQSGTKPAERDRLLASLKTWQTCPDLAIVRDQESLRRLPDAERKEWGEFWDAVDKARQAANEENSDKPDSSAPNP